MQMQTDQMCIVPHKDNFFSPISGSTSRTTTTHQEIEDNLNQLRWQSDIIQRPQQTRLTAVPLPEAENMQ